MMQTTARLWIALVLAVPLRAEPAQKVFRVGAAVIDVSPPKLPVLVSGNFLSRTAAKVNDPVYARCVALDDGATRLVIAVVDSCMMPRELLDEAKAMASRPRWK